MHIVLMIHMIPSWSVADSSSWSQPASYCRYPHYNCQLYVTTAQSVCSCDVGYSSTTGHSPCQACPAGSGSWNTNIWPYYNYPGSDTAPCMCFPGYYGVAAPGTGYFGPGRISSYAPCYSCPTGTWTTAYGATSCPVCAIGYFGQPMFCQSAMHTRCVV